MSDQGSCKDYDKVYQEEELELYKKQIELAIEQQFQQIDKSNADSTFKRDDDSQFDNLGESYNLMMKQQSEGLDKSLNERGSSLNKSDTIITIKKNIDDSQIEESVHNIT